MFLPRPQDAIHKAWLLRILHAFFDNRVIATNLYFKGGTCAALLGWLDRFSLDLDFDYVATKKEMTVLRKEMESVFKILGLTIKDASKETPQYFLRYDALPNQRNTIKIDVTYPPPKSNEYQPFTIPELGRVAVCQSRETWFANKLVAFIERFEQQSSIAGRDLYDIHHFFLQGFRYHAAVIEERRATTLPLFFKNLVTFTEQRVTQTLIDHDLNALLMPDKFQKIRKILKRETLMFLRDEAARLTSGREV